MQDTPDRRTILGSIAGATTAGMAGCGGGGDGDDGATTRGVTASTTARPTTATATADRPSIERQTILRDKAAIVHVRQTVSGEITWPTLTSFDPVDAALLGEWASGDVALRFTDEGQFVQEGPDGTQEGTWATREETLVIQYNTGEQYAYSYQVETGADGAVVSVVNRETGDTAQYEQTRDGVDERDVLAVFEDLVVVTASDPSTEGGDVETGFAGSGFVVTPAGHVVTNAHVVGVHRDPTETLYNRLAVRSREAARETVAAEYDLTEAQQRRATDILLEKLFAYFSEHSTVNGVSDDVGVLHGTAAPDEEFTVNSWDATVETAGTVREEVSGEPTWGRDVAILSIDVDATLPTVRLGSSTDLGTGASVFVVGYPDIEIQSLFEDRTATLEPTLTSGVVSARRTLNSGVEAIQTDAGINHGNSGGPIYDDEGRVVGIATFKPTALDLDEVAFGLPIETATGFMGELGVENRPGELTEHYEAGLEALWRDDCAALADELEAVQSLWADHPYADALVDRC